MAGLCTILGGVLGWKTCQNLKIWIFMGIFDCFDYWNILRHEILFFVNYEFVHRPRLLLAMCVDGNNNSRRKN